MIVHRGKTYEDPLDLIKRLEEDLAAANLQVDGLKKQLLADFVDAMPEGSILVKRDKWEETDRLLREARRQVETLMKDLAERRAKEPEHGRLDHICLECEGIAEARIFLAKPTAPGPDWAVCGWCAGMGKVEGSAARCPKCNGAGGKNVDHS